MKKEFIVFNQRTAGYLMLVGFVLKRIERTTKDDKRKNIFVFNESESLLKSIEDYKQQYGKN